MCRVLKQLGSGSVASGVSAVTRDPSAQYSVATTLGVEKHVLLEELSRLPRGNKGAADVDLAKMYTHLSGGRGATRMSDSEHHRSIFAWCARCENSLHASLQP